MNASLAFHISSAPVTLLLIYPTARLRVRSGRSPRRMGPRFREVPVASAWVRSRTRRAFECAIAALALVLLFPVFAFCWAMVGLTSTGSGLFRQMRSGRYGRTFALYKFRSMRTSDAGGWPAHTVHNDKRITAVGAFLRRYKLDELPQFWNVLKGDMSLVGPRPKLPHHEGLEMPYRPGLTGSATLAFRHEERMLLEVPSHQVEHFYQAVVKPIKARMDLEYMREATFASDLRMLWLTMKRCFECNVDARAELLELVNRYAPHARDYLTIREVREEAGSLNPTLPLASFSDECAQDDAA